MKKLLLLAGCLVSTISVVYGTQQFYIITSPIEGGCTTNFSMRPPTIDAYNVVNRSRFNVYTYDCLYVAAPYEMQNLWSFTNTASASMFGDLGFRFDYFDTAANLRYPMGNWINDGMVNGIYWLTVNSRLIKSTGPLEVGPTGLLRLEGDNIILSRDGLRAGLFNDLYYSGGETLPLDTNLYAYINPLGITDNYWAIGSNNSQSGGTNAGPMVLPGMLDLPCSQSPSNEVTLWDGTLAITNFPWTQSSTTCIPYKAYVYLSYPDPSDPTTKEYQIVYMPENLGSNFYIDARFYPVSGMAGESAADIVVGFQLVNQDPVDLSYNTNALYLIDRAGTMTEITLATEALSALTSRPNNYDLLRYAPLEWTNRTATGPNMLFTNTILYNPAYRNNQVPITYSSYSANLNYNSSSSYSSFIGDPTNYVGRVELSGGNLNLDQARIRAETTVLIRAKTNLVNNKLPKVDALYCSYDLHTKQSPLIITNIAPRNVARMSGNIYCWSGMWENYESYDNVTTNRVKFHVLMVYSDLTAFQPVSVFELFLQSTNIVLCDPMTVTRAINLDCMSLDVRSDLKLPQNASWAVTNVPQLYWFTNRGFINIPGSASYGTDRAYPYQNFINSGTNIAAAQSINTVNFENSGSGLLAGTAGMISLKANSVKMQGNMNIYLSNSIPQPYSIRSNYIAWVVGTNYLQQVVTNTSGTNVVVTTNQTPFLVTNPVPTSVVVWLTNYIPQTITNSVGPRLYSASDIQICARDMYVSNSVIQAGQGGPNSMGALIMSVTNNLVNCGPALNEWVTSAGFQMLVRPTNSDLMATHITSKAPRFREIPHIWIGQDRGYTNCAGYSNNLALAKLTLDGEAQSLFRFSAPAGYNNRAMYIDYLELLNDATNHQSSIVIDPSITLYVANANVPPRKLELTHGGRIRWVPYFTGPYSTTNITYPSGRTYPFNIALITDKEIDSDQDGIPNASDPTPIFVNESFALNISLLPGNPGKSVISWMSLGNTTNWLQTKGPLSTNWSPLATVVSGPTRSQLAVTNSLSNEQQFYRVLTPTPPPF